MFAFCRLLSEFSLYVFDSLALTFWGFALSLSAFLALVSVAVAFASPLLFSLSVSLLDGAALFVAASQSVVLFGYSVLALLSISLVFDLDATPTRVRRTRWNAYQSESASALVYTR